MPFAQPEIRVFLLEHDPEELVVAQFDRVYLSHPLEFMSLPITVTVTSLSSRSPLKDVTYESIEALGGAYELLVLMSFTDNMTGKSVEIKKSWRLDQIQWGREFKSIMRRVGNESNGLYEVDLTDFNVVQEVEEDY